MTIWPRYRLRLSLGRPAATPMRRRVWLAAAAAATIGLLAGPAIPAVAAGNPGNVSVSVSVASQAVKSVTLSVSSTTFTNCVYGSSTSTVLGFPDGACEGASPITVTNGTASATILVSGTSMNPADNGTDWALEDPADPGVPQTYGGTSPEQPPAPGANEYLETTSTSPGYDFGSQLGSGPWQVVSTPNICDYQFNGCAGPETPGQSANEYLAMTGPSSSTDLSSTFTTTITWTAS